MAKSPAHCWGLYIDPGRPEQKTTEAMLLGSLTHCAALEPDEMANRYIVKPEGMSFASKEGKTWRDSVTPGLQIVDFADWDKAQKMAAAIQKVGVLRKLLSSGAAESSIFWQDKATGLRCRCRPDFLHYTGKASAVAIDVKTISDLTPESAARSIERYGYHRQAAHYSNGIKAAGFHLEEFVFAFVSSSFPHVAVAYVLDEETMEQGADEVAALLDKYAHCVKTGHWPAFGDGYQQIGLPKWAKTQSEVEIAYA